ncbi:MAG TPA: UDP-forming cellulose synthase catalytic subunit [Usitatibacter sp.]|nr:UDP-forming cellulose synthase catalytic subunit [Usitatibacter sp.]
MDTVSDTHRTLLIPRRSRKRSVLRAMGEIRQIPPSVAPLVFAAGMLLYMIHLREAHFGEVVQLVSGWACVAMLFAIGRVPAARRNTWRLVFVLLSGYLTLRYLWWRSFETLIYTNPVDFVGMSLLFIAELYSITVHLLGLFVNVWPLEREPVPMPADRSKWPTVDIFIPTYSEDPEIVRLTAIATTQIDYPRDLMRIYICDDGGTLAKRAHEEKGPDAWRRRYRLKEIAAEVGAEYLTRETNRSAKAGNLNHALINSSGEYVLFLDCDHVPTAEILQRTLGYFLVDSKVFLVQTPHFFVNAAPAEKAIGAGAAVPDESEMFYRVIHPGLDSWNASYFCGSAAVMRRKYLEEVGGMSGQSITEDAETAFELHRRGYRSVYVNHPMVCGLAPESYADYMLQHTRWAQGMVQIFILHDPLFVPGLSMAQRLCYFNCCLFWFFGVARVIYFLAPTAFLIFGLAIYHASAPQIVAYALPYVISTFIVTDFFFGQMRRPFFSEIYESVQSVFLAPAVLSAVRHPHRPSFKVTPKGIGVKEEQLNSLSLVFFGLLCLNLVAVASGATRFWAQPEFRDVIAVTIIWGVYNIYLAMVSIGALWEKRQIRQHHRLSVAGTAMVQFPRMRKRLNVDLVDLSLTGMSIRSKLGFEVKSRERVLIEASGADGLVSYFEGEVKRSRVSEDGSSLLGLQFLKPRESFVDIVRFVYGDSRRWLAVWDKRSAGIPLLDLFSQLGRMGLRGSWVCAVIVARASWHYVKGAGPRLRKGAVALAAAAVAMAAQAETMQLPFEQLTGLKKIELRCIADQREIQVPLPERWNVKRAVIHLRYTVSANLIPDSSTLVVKVRGEPIAQARLNPQSPEVKLGVQIPLPLLEPGYNSIVFAVTQHASKNQCESPCTPDLWTNISLRDSYVEMEYDLKPLPRELSALSTHVFDPRLMPAGEVHIVTADTSVGSAALAGIVASGVARRFDYRRVGFTVSRSLKPGVDNVVVGKRSFVQKVPGVKAADLATPLKGGYLKLLPMLAPDGAADPAHALLLLSGEDDAATKLAAITFSNISFRFPGTDELRAFDFALPEVSQYSGRETIATDTIYTLKTLNFPTQSWVGLNPGERSISFRLPPDFHIRPNQHAKLLMNFSYGVGLKNDSSFNVGVNGRGVRAVRLDSPTGTFIENYELNIPTYVFQPGTNVISFAAHLNSGGQVCDLLQPDGLFFTLYENSSISFPPMPHFVEMPKLELFMHSGFPITRWPDGHEAYVWLADKDDRTLAAALNLVGLATQRNGFPLFGLTFTYDKPAEAGEILVVGAAPAVDREIRTAAPLKLLEDGVTVPYPVVRGWNTEATAATSRQQSALGAGRGLLMQFQSPYQAGRSVVMLTAASADDLLATSRMVLTGTVQSQSRGDLVLIETGEKEPKVTAIEAGARYATGKKGTYSPLESFLYTRPIAYYGVIGLSLLLFVSALYFVLKRWRAKRRAIK